MAGAPNFVSSFPPPPPFYKLFETPTTSDAEPQKPQYSRLEPPAPIEGTYKMFGAIYTTAEVFSTLEEQGKQQLYPKETINPVEELKKLNKSLMFSFLELLNVLLDNPTTTQVKVADIELIVVNMHHLINSYRSHQARHYLIDMMKNQIRLRNQTTQNVRQKLNSVKESLRDAITMLRDSTQSQVNIDLKASTQEENAMEIEPNINRQTDTKFLQVQQLIENIKMD